MKILETLPLPVVTPRTITGEEYALGRPTVSMFVPKPINLQVDPETVVAYSRGPAEVPSGAACNALLGAGAHMYGYSFPETPAPLKAQTPSPAQALMGASVGVHAALRSKF